MGVPVITLAGDHHAGRVGASLLTSLGLTDLIAQDIDSYIETALKMASARDYLRTIRKNLRGRMLDSCLCDGFSFANEIEKIYRKI